MAGIVDSVMNDINKTQPSDADMGEERTDADGDVYIGKETTDDDVSRGK